MYAVDVRDVIDSPLHHPLQSSSAAGSFRLQGFIGGRANPEDASLCTRRSGDREAVWKAGEVIAAGEQVSFDAYFNSFYEDYWARHTGLDQVSIEVSGEGCGWIVVRRALADGSSLAVRHALLNLRPGEPLIFPMKLEQGGSSRLFVEIGAIGGALTIHDLSWATDRPARRATRVGVALCCYNREDFILRTVNSLLTPGLRSILQKIVVVNQGGAFSSPMWKSLQRSFPGRLLIIDQLNFGGAGGFTRGALEFLDDPAVDHVLFMDDDIELEPVHLATAAAFAGHADQPLVVGGQMLDLFHRARIFESGSKVTQGNLLEANHRNLELDKAPSLRQLSAVVDCDFNAWWFALIPSYCFRQHGLPNPIFIRGDDQEFGVRLRRAGVLTVSAPPVSVWHEPFSSKPPGWQLYYDLRNRLIFASLYPDEYHLDGWAQLMKRLLSMLLRYDYQQALSIRLALADFLKGPALDAEGSPRTHQRVLDALAGSEHPLDSSRPVRGVGCDSHPSGRFGGRLHLGIAFFRSLLGAPKQNSAGSGCVFYPEMPLDLMHLGRSYVLSDEGGHFAVRFSHSTFRTWAHLLTTSITIARYAVARRRVATLWQREMPGLASVTSWRRRLGLIECEASA